MIAHEKGLKIHTQPQTGAYSCWFSRTGRYRPFDQLLTLEQVTRQIFDKFEC